MNIKKLVEQVEQHEDHATRVWVAARGYVELGLAVLPLRPNTKILPEKKYGVSYKQAAQTLEQVDAFFKPNEGTFSGWNIAIPCGKEGGIFVVDLDTTRGENGKSGLTAWSELLEQLGVDEPQTLTQSTPSGGRHLIFQWFPGGKSSTHKIAPRIDTRGGTESDYKSHIAVYPSCLESGCYEIENAADIATAPDWLRRQLVGVDILKDKTSEIRTKLDQKTAQSGELLAKTRQALSFIDADEDYDTWLMVGMAIHNSFPNDTGKQLWDEWSQRGSAGKYDPIILNAKWASFDVSDFTKPVVTLHYLFGEAERRAKERGESFNADVPVGDDEQPALDTLMAELNRTCFVNAGADRFEICVESGDGLRRMAKHDAADFFANKSIKIDVDGKIKEINPIQFWVKYPNRRELKGFAFAPHMTRQQVEEQLGMYNLFNGFRYAPIDHGYDLSLFIDELVGEIICNGDPKMKEWVLDWVADIFQNPEKKKGTALVLAGEQGTGKSIFAEIIAELVGDYAGFDTTQGRRILTRFNDMLQNKLLIVIDELGEAQGRKLQEELKAFITGEKIAIEKKGRDSFTIDNYCRVIITTNHEFAIAGEATNRRYLSLLVNGKRRNDMDFFNKLAEMKTNKQAMETLMHFFMNRQIKDLNTLRRAPETRLMAAQKISSFNRASTFNMFIADCITNGQFPEMADVNKLKQMLASVGAISNQGAMSGGMEFLSTWPSMAFQKDLINAFTMWMAERPLGNSRASYDMAKIKTTLKRLGFEFTRIRTSGFPASIQDNFGQRPTAIVFPDSEQAIKNLAEAIGVTEDDLLEAF